MGIGITQFSPPGKVSTLVWDEDMEAGAGKIFKGDLTGNVSGNVNGNVTGYLERECNLTLTSPGNCIIGDLAETTNNAFIPYGASVVEVQTPMGVKTLLDNAPDSATDVYLYTPKVGARIAGNLPVNIGLYNTGVTSDVTINAAIGTLKSYTSSGALIQSVATTTATADYYTPSLKTYNMTTAIDTIAYVVYSATITRGGSNDSYTSGACSVEIPAAVLYGVRINHA